MPAHRALRDALHPHRKSQHLPLADAGQEVTVGPEPQAIGRGCMTQPTVPPDKTPSLPSPVAATSPPPSPRPAPVTPPLLRHPPPRPPPPHLRARPPSTACSGKTCSNSPIFFAGSGWPSTR